MGILIKKKIFIWPHNAFSPEINLGQTQVELSGLNRVFHELGPPRGVAEYMH